jgi:hypothetical protein
MTPLSSSSTSVVSPRVGMTISANAASNGILWETTGDSTIPSVPGTLHAFDAVNLSDELWNSNENASEDSLGGFAKFANPTVANGNVYVATSSGAVVAYGLLCTAGIRAQAPACAGPQCQAVRQFAQVPRRCPDRPNRIASGEESAKFADSCGGAKITCSASGAAVL